MEKRFSSIIAIIMVVVLTFPSINVHAQGNIDTSLFYPRTKASVEGFWGTDETKQAIQENVTYYSYTVTDTYGTAPDELCDYLQNYDTYNNFSVYESFFINYDYVAIFYRNSPRSIFFIFCNAGENVPFIYNTSTATARGNYRICYDYSTSATYCYLLLSTLSYARDYAWWGHANTDSTYKYLDWGSTQQNALLYTNIPVYAHSDVYAVLDGELDNGTEYNAIQQNRETYTNYFSDGLPYIDVDGEIVYPGSGEVENLAIGFRKVDGNVIYNRQNKTYSTGLFTYETDPTSYEYISSGNWGIQFTHRVQFVIHGYPDGNINYNSVYRQGGFEYQETIMFSSSEDEFSYRGGQRVINPTRAVSLNGGSSDCYYFAVLVALEQNNVLSGNGFNDRFGALGGTILNFIADAESATVGTLTKAIEDVSGISLGNWLYQHVNTDYYYALENYSLQTTAVIVNEDGSVKGIPSNTYFDFTSKTSTSYAEGTTPTPTPENPTPEANPPYEIVTETPVEADGVNPSTGQVVYVPVEVNVNVPSNTVDGNNNMTQNFAPNVSGGNASVVVDSGLDDLKETVENYPDVTNKKFWEYFLVFKDNEFLDAVGDYLDALPGDLKALLISSFGIVGVFAIYRFVRK